MGLDGISVNQLRISSELNSGELNKINQENFPQVVDGLTQGQRINADEKKEKEENKKNTKRSNKDEDLKDNEQNDELSELNAVKYDLSDNNKYILKLEEESGNILIIDKKTQQVIQKFNPEALSNLTKYLKNYTGVLINKRY